VQIANDKRQISFVVVFLPPSSPFDIPKCGGTRMQEVPKYVLEDDFLFMSNKTYQQPQSNKSASIFNSIWKATAKEIEIEDLSTKDVIVAYA